MCKSWCELLIGILIVVFAIWETAYSQWVLVVLGIILIGHSFMCKTCHYKAGEVAKVAKVSRSKKKR